MIKFLPVRGLLNVGDDGLFPYFTKVYGVDRTGCGLPASLKDLFPGAGGSAAKAGAKRQTVWDYTRSGFDYLALTAWNIPENKDVDTVVAGAQKGILLLWDVGYCTVQALAHHAATGAYFFRRLHHQTNIYETVAGHVTPLELAPFLPSVKGNSVEKALFIGAKDQVGARLIASRVPERRVPERRGKARKNAKKKDSTPSYAHLTLFAWNLFMTNVPQTIWKPETVIKVYPGRWQREIIFQYNFLPERVKSLKGSKRHERMLIVLLDEMNLARIEYYFSEFLSKLEIRRTVKDPSEPNQRAPAEFELETGPGSMNLSHY